jgi:hypothetical protein
MNDHLAQLQRKHKAMSIIAVSATSILVGIVTWKASLANPIRPIHYFLPGILWIGVVVMALALRRSYVKLDEAAIEKTTSAKVSVLDLKLRI